MEQSEMKSYGQTLKRLGKHYFDYYRLTALDKLIVLLSAVAMGAVLLALAMVMLFYLSATLVLYLSGVVEDPWVANLIVSTLALLLICLVIVMRKKWIVNPISRFITKLFLVDDANKPIEQ